MAAGAAALDCSLDGGRTDHGESKSDHLVLRLLSRTRSAPSAIGTVGGNIGGQIGLELTDLVFILNDEAAVRTLSEAGSLTLGTNVSVAAGPVGRNAEAAGAASLKGVAGIFAYSDTKGLFAGVSLEGSVIIERKDENKKFYGRPVSARQLLNGDIPFPPQAEDLRKVLSLPVFTAPGGGMAPSSSGLGAPPGESAFSGGSASPMGGFDQKTNEYSSQVSGVTPAPYPAPPMQSKPGRPSAPKPAFGGAPAAATGGLEQATAAFNFDAQQSGDLSFMKGDTITIIKKTQSEMDWWTGRNNRTNLEGSFPSNYVELLPR